MGSAIVPAISAIVAAGSSAVGVASAKKASKAAAPSASAVEKEPTVDVSSAAGEDMVSRRRRARYGNADTVTAKSPSGGGLGSAGNGAVGITRTLG